jgi:hypothetical protein
MGKLLQVNFTWDLPAEEKAKYADPDGPRQIADQPGLHWKIWIHDEATNSAGGIYLWEDEKSARAWGDDLLPKRLAQLPNVRDISIRYFDIDPEASAVTRAPLPSLAAAAR